MAEVTLHRSLVADLPMHTPEMGWTQADYEMVTGIHILDHHIYLNHSGWREHEVTQLDPIRQEMPQKMVTKLLEFCDLTFVAGNPDFDCHSFTGFLMGWKATPTPGSSVRINRASIKNFNRTRANAPYVAYAPNARQPIAHSFLGTERQGYGLSVAGPGMPIVLSRLVDLVHTYGVSELYKRSG